MTACAPADRVPPAAPSVAAPRAALWPTTAATQTGLPEDWSPTPSTIPFAGKLPRFALFARGSQERQTRGGVIMSSSRERQAWTEFVEARERKAKRPRAMKSPQPTPEELERALDDLTSERLDTRGNSPMDTSRR